jgi:lysine-specific demethylase/histidyl-hydroxylase NO66
LSDHEPGAALRRCTGLDRTTFEEAYWSRWPLVARQVDGGFADLLSGSDVDELIAERGLGKSSFRMVKAGATVLSVNDSLDPEAVREHFADGATFVLESLHRIHPPLVKFCRRLALDLGHRTQCNAYITPPGSQGFAAHYDTHDVFVLQVEGHKRWNVHSPVLPLPLKSQPSNSLPNDGPLVANDKPPMQSVVLGPGDALYLPRGFIHEAETTDDRSIHLTVGITPTTGYDVLLDVIALAAEDIQFRQALPLGSADDQLAAVSEIVSRAAQWMGELPAERLHDAVRRRVSAVAVPEPLRMLASQEQLRDLSKETVVRPREALCVDLISQGDRVVLRMSDRELSLPLSLGPALASLLAAPCRVDELDLPVDDALVLVRRLLREGVVTVR